MANRVGQRLGNYELNRILGKGGFAEVYLATHVHVGNEAAIKVLQVQLQDDERDNFLREARTLVTLTHRHIIRMLDFGVENDIPFLIMDYAPNGNLRTRHLQQKTLPFPTIVSYVNQVTDALAYAHAKKLIHRDIKPENMLVGRDDEVLLSDFGTAIAVQSSSSIRNPLSAIGTLAYMAPEQFQGNPQQASDQYSLGIVVYEWLNGVRPFKGTESEIIAQQLQQPPPPMQHTIPPNIQNVVMKALAKDPKQRFANIRDFATALEKAVSSAPKQNGHNTQPLTPHSDVTVPYQPTPGSYQAGSGPIPPMSPIPPTQVPTKTANWQEELQWVIERLRGTFKIDFYIMKAPRFQFFRNTGFAFNILSSLLLGLELRSLWTGVIGLVLSLTLFFLFLILMNRTTTLLLAFILAGYWGIVGSGLPGGLFMALLFFALSLFIHIRHTLNRNI